MPEDLRASSRSLDNHFSHGQMAAPAGVRCDQSNKRLATSLAISARPMLGWASWCQQRACVRSVYERLCKQRRCSWDLSQSTLLNVRKREVCGDAPNSMRHVRRNAASAKVKNPMLEMSRNSDIDAAQTKVRSVAQAECHSGCRLHYPVQANAPLGDAVCRGKCVTLAASRPKCDLSV